MAGIFAQEDMDMSEEGTSVTTQRQLPAGSETNTGEESAGEAVGSQETTETASTDKGDKGSEETFYDPKDLPDELKGHFKQMQRAYTKKMQALSQSRSKIQAYDQFSSDPIGTMQRLAAQHGFQLTRAEAAQAAQQQQQNWEPRSWDEVVSKIKTDAVEEARQKLLQDLNPYLGEIKRTKVSNIERALDDEVPEWREYETEMVEMLQLHPTLANDPTALARLVIPEEKQKARAMQEALKKMEKKTTAAKVSGGSSTSKTANTGKPNRPVSFNEAVAFAKEKLARQGLRA